MSIRKRTLNWIVFIIMVCIVISSISAKRIYVVVDNAKLRRSLISIPLFKNIEGNTAVSDIGEDLRKIIRHDLDFTHMFTFIDPKDMVPFGRDGYEQTQINFKEWSVLGTEFLVTGGFKVQDKDLVFDARLYDVRNGKMIMGKKYTANQEDVRALAHRFCDQVVEELTGDKGVFQTKILFISDKTKHKELYAMDFDGENVKQLTYHNSIVLSPAWSSDGKKVTYSGFATHANHIKNNDLFLLDLSSGKEKVLSDKNGMNSGSSWSADGKDIALTMSYEGNPEIYLIDVDGNNPRRLTQNPNLDVESAWSPDGKKIVFSSGRAPLAHLYVMDRNGENVSRLTFAGRFNSAPSWSPKGNKIAFSGQLGSYFDLFMLNPDGSGLQRLTRSGPKENNEHPSWSPNGRHIIFSSKRSGQDALYIMDDDGGNERPLLEDFGHLSHPAWSPYLY